MRVAIISDIHDNIPKMRAALDAMQAVDCIVCLGDLCSPFMIKELGPGFDGPIHIVFGNNDGDRHRIAAVARQYEQIVIHGEFVDLELGGRRFAVQHFDNIGHALAHGDVYDVVCFGHSHEDELTRHGDTLVVNPGEIFGGLTGQSTFVIYDCESADAELVEL